MAKYVVVAASLGVPTGGINLLTHLPDIRRFRKGDTVDSDQFDTEVGRNKIERLLHQGALRDPADVERASRYQSDFDIPLDRDPGGVAATPEIIRLPGDDIEDDEDDASEPLVPRLPSLVDGTPEARLAGEPVDPADTGGDVAPEPEDEEAEVEAEPVPDGPLPEPPSRGASTAIWQQFAARARLGTSPDASRTEIQEAYDAKVAERS